MASKVQISAQFTLDDIRKLRDDFSLRHTDASGRIDWVGAAEEQRKGAEIALAEVMRIRKEKAKTV